MFFSLVHCIWSTGKNKSIKVWKRKKALSRSGTKLNQFEVLNPQSEEKCLRLYLTKLLFYNQPTKPEDNDCFAVENKPVQRFISTKTIRKSANQIIIDTKGQSTVLVSSHGTLQRARACFNLARRFSSTLLCAELLRVGNKTKGSVYTASCWDFNYGGSVYNAFRRDLN